MLADARVRSVTPRRQHGQLPDDFSPIAVGTQGVTLRTIGIDIGSSTTLFSVSLVELALIGSRFLPIKRDVIHNSSILLTPYDRAGLIDVAKLQEFFRRELNSAGLGKADIDTGAVILTGNALERQNSRLVSEAVARVTGQFVVTAAGDDLEASLSAFGSGAVGKSRGLGVPLLHVDVGGGTTKFAWCEAGRVVSTSAVRVGARMVAVGDDGHVLHVTEAGKQILASLGHTLERGGRLAPSVAEDLAAFVVDSIVDVIVDAPTRQTIDLMLTTPAQRRGGSGVVTFGGGVSEYVYGRERRNYGDIGPAIGRLLRDRLGELGLRVADLPRGIRSTVTGASQFTAQVTSQTVHVENGEVLPLRNVPIVVIDIGDLGEHLEREAVRSAVITAASPYLASRSETLGVGLRWAGSASYARLDALASSLVDAMGQSWSAGRPAVIVADADIGGLLGNAVRRYLASDVALVTVDGIEPGDFDHVDIGPVDPSTGTLPVIVKSLLFPPIGPELRSGSASTGNDQRVHEAVIPGKETR